LHNTPRYLLHTAHASVYASIHSNIADARCRCGGFLLRSTKYGLSLEQKCRSCTATMSRRLVSHELRKTRHNTRESWCTTSATSRWALVSLRSRLNTAMTLTKRKMWFFIKLISENMLELRMRCFKKWCADGKVTNFGCNRQGKNMWRN